MTHYTTRVLEGAEKSQIEGSTNGELSGRRDVIEEKSIAMFGVQLYPLGLLREIQVIEQEMRQREAKAA